MTPSPAPPGVDGQTPAAGLVNDAEPGGRSNRRRPAQPSVESAAPRLAVGRIGSTEPSRQPNRRH